MSIWPRCGCGRLYEVRGTTTQTCCEECRMDLVTIINPEVIMSRIAWCLKQIVPLTYRSKYQTLNEEGHWERHFSVWRMWFGRVFDHEDVVLHEI